jgi:protein RecA
MAPKKKNDKPVEIDLSALAGDTGLTLLRDSDYAMVFDRLPTFLPRIDKVFGGGLPFGRMVEIAGKPGGGKSTIAFHIARVGTALGCIVVLIDVEGTADRVRLAHLGIDINKVLVKQPKDDPKNPKNSIKLTVEEVGRTIEQTLLVFKESYPNVPVIYIWDSVGQTPSEDEMAKDFGEKNVGARAKAITQFVTKIGPEISASKSLLIGINQVRDDIGGNPMFPTYNVPGGNAWEHYASLRLEIQQKKAIKKGESKIGHQMGVHIRKSKVSRPFQIANTFLISDNGLDYEYNLANMAEEDKILKGVGMSYEYVDRFGTIHKMKKENFIEWLRTEEGQPVRQELMNRLILFYFEDGKYPGLANATVDISGWIDKVDLESVAGEQPMTSDNEFNLDSELEGIIPE